MRGLEMIDGVGQSICGRASLAHDHYVSGLSRIPGGTAEALHQAGPRRKIGYQRGCGDVDASLHDLRRHDNPPACGEGRVSVQERLGPLRPFVAAEPAVYQGEIGASLLACLLLPLALDERTFEGIENLDRAFDPIENDER